MPMFTQKVRAWMVVSAAAFMLLAWPTTGMAAADNGRPQAKPEERAAALIRPSVMYLAAESAALVRLPDGEILSQFGRGSSIPFLATWRCTAFVVNPDGWVATAGHCVDPESAKVLLLKRAANEYRIQFPDAPESREPAVAFDWLQKNARLEGETPDQGPHVGVTVMSGTGTKLTEKLPATVVDFRPLAKGDAALLKVAKRNLPSSELDTDADVTVGTPILAVGFPASTQNVTGPSLDPTNKSGKISKKSVMGSAPEYEIDAAMTDGMSGGPAIGLNGKVIGVNSFAPAGETQAFNFISPAEGLAAILAGKGIKATLGPADLSYRKGLSHYYSGRYTDAIADFDQTLGMSPGYPGLDDLRTSAFNLRQQYGDTSRAGGKVRSWYILASAVSVVGLASALAYVALKRRRLPPASAAASGGTSAGTGAAQPLRLVPSRQPGANEPHFCANCGAEHHPAERFCPNCGQRIELSNPRGKPA
ncbi:trypsin [Mycobacterium alsense]|nr:trypsin [Mycobacterium alsense]